MAAAESHFATCEGREIHYLEWGDRRLPPVLAWHGLARVGMDFDVLARRLSDRFRIIAPDTIGRGLSQWAEHGDSEYCFAMYARIAVALCDQLGIETVRWIGTSMGGSLGIWVAGGSMADRITHLVINDIGPELPRPAMSRIATYLARPPVFDTISELERYLQTVYAPFGYIAPEQWRVLAKASARRLDNGKVTTHYDPRIAGHFEAHPQDWQLWQRYDAIAAHCLLLRGEDSDLLDPAMAEEMTRRGPQARLIRVAGCGHAPALNVPDQIDPIAAFLASSESDEANGRRHAEAGS